MPRKPRLQALTEGGRHNAEGLGYALAVALPSLIEDVAGITVTDEQLTIAAAVIVSIAVRLKEWLV